jgi:hypothetical protein
LPESERVAAVLALLDLGAAFGNPHIHSGIGIRKLTRGIFECRASLTERFIFQEATDALVVVFLGNHDEVRQWLRDL